MSRLIIWGTGKKAGRYMEESYFSQHEIIGFIDSNRYGIQFWDYPVFSPEQGIKLEQEIDYYFIAIEDCAEVVLCLLKHGISEDKIIALNMADSNIYQCNKQLVKQLSEKLYNQVILQYQKRIIAMNEKDQTDEVRLVGEDGFDNYYYMNDYFRFRTFEFLAEELLEKNIPGAVAELGVFRGNFAKLINQKFPEKKFYLFDTFEGFREEEINREIEIGRCDEAFKKVFKDTSVDNVMEKLSYPDNCIVCKGLFPETVTEDMKNLEFSFVSLDVDLEDTTYEGLAYFYPRLVEGGYIFIHDYNSSYLYGVRNAVRRYEEDNHIQLKKVPIADRSGTLVIVK